MPGTVVRDTLAPDLLSGKTLTTAGGAFNGTAWEALWPGEVQFTLYVPTATGTTPTMTVTIEGCETSDFSTDDVVAYGTFSVVDPADASNFGLTTYVDSKYVRASGIVTGTSGVMTGSTLTPVLPHDRRVRGTAPTSRVLA